MERRLDRCRKRLHRQGFRQARHAFEQHVPVRQQADQQPFDEIFLADDDLADLADQSLHEFAFAFDLFVNCVDSLFHILSFIGIQIRKASRSTPISKRGFNFARWLPYPSPSITIPPTSWPPASSDVPAAPLLGSPHQVHPKEPVPLPPSLCGRGALFREAASIFRLFHFAYVSSCLFASRSSRPSNSFPQALHSTTGIRP